MINIEAEQLGIKSLWSIKGCVQELGNKEDFINKLRAEKVRIKEFAKMANVENKSLKIYNKNQVGPGIRPSS